MRYIRKVAKKLFLLLAIALTVSFSSEVFAAEIQESDTYVLDRDANGGYLYRKEDMLKRIKDFTDKEITL